MNTTNNDDQTEANTLAHKLAEAREDNVRIIVERERWRMQAEEKWALRKELEELLGVADAPASDEQFKLGVQRLKDVIRELAEARAEVARLREELADARNHEYAGELKAAHDEVARLREALTGDCSDDKDIWPGYATIAYLHAVKQADEALEETA